MILRLSDPCRRVAVPAGRVTLPEHDAFLPWAGVQWWYWTGHLESEDGRRFGFETVFFAFRKWGWFQAILAHHALTDVAAGRFCYGEHTRLFQLPRRRPAGFLLVADEAHSLVVEGGGGRDRIISDLGDYRLDLELEATAAPVILYEGSAHAYACGGYTFYYGRQRLRTRGTLTVGRRGPTLAVRGESWFDRQYGELLPVIREGWKWFAIQLADGRDLMVFQFHQPWHADESFASLTESGRTRILGPQQCKAFPTDEWQSPHTGACYPSGWRVKAPEASLDLLVEPCLKDQELRARHSFWPGPQYWEGACTVSRPDGSPAGRAYVELSGYLPGLFGTVDRTS
jgi:predicted secreted hydrolase